jgi:hypothetical protein
MRHRLKLLRLWYDTCRVSEPFSSPDLGRCAWGATFYIASLPFQDALPNGGSRAPTVASDCDAASLAFQKFTSTEVVYGVTGTEVTELPEYGVSP